MKLGDILNMFRQGKSTARSHMKNLIKIAAADGNFKKVEQDLLVRIAKRNGISESQLKKIKSDTDEVELEIPVLKKERFEQLYDLVHMMIIDENIHPEELKLCNLFAIRFGFKTEYAEDLVQSIKNNIHSNHDHSETMLRLEWMLTK
jgi:uncharacterized tellurite resistance protein B-like protein